MSTQTKWVPAKCFLFLQRWKLSRLISGSLNREECCQNDYAATVARHTGDKARSGMSVFMGQAGEDGGGDIKDAG